ncbi:head maturation protease, ClpP-related [Cohnella sp. WQ 127256]|uniref:head maturation protease, ClpP-related n=1 Tax=Cohnella sp. WQ 127256 TaxID=2938790 RepID=UPI0021182175|nr:head maturation protease, ClpP-related [Cohnella sp. WQ 127256]
MKYLNIKNSTDTQADIYFYGDIVGSEWEKWTGIDTAPQDVLNMLDQVKGKGLNIYINSGGGSVFAGLAIYNILKRHQGYKTVYVDGLAASISSVIAMAGDKIIVPSNAFMMIHSPWSWSMGNASDFRKLADDLDRIEEGIMNVYADNLREGVDIEIIREMVNAETWLNGNEAAKYFNIEVAEANNVAACISDNFKSYRNVPEQLRRNEPEPEKKIDDNNEIEILKLTLELL